MKKRGTGRMWLVASAAIGTAVGLSTAFGATAADASDLVAQTSNCCYTQQCNGGGSVTHCSHRNCSSAEKCQGSGNAADCTALAQCVRKNAIVIDIDPRVLLR